MATPEQPDLIDGLPPTPTKPKRAKSVKAEIPVIHRFDEPFKDFGRRRWYNGCGSDHPDIVFVDSWPGEEIKRTNRPLADRVGRCLQWLLKLADISPARCYYTYAVKFPFQNGKKPSATERHLCETMLREELELLKPKVVVAFGSDAWAAVAGLSTVRKPKPMTEHDFHEAKANLAYQRFESDDNPLTGETDDYGVPLRARGYFEIMREITDAEVQAYWSASGMGFSETPMARKYPFACCRGEPIPAEGRTLFPTFNLPQVMMNGGEGYKDRMNLADIPQHILVHRAVRELKLVKRLADGEDLKAEYAKRRPSYDVLTTPEQVAALHTALKTGSPDNLICLDFVKRSIGE